jgi:hypothetical protein
VRTVEPAQAGEFPEHSFEHPGALHIHVLGGRDNVHCGSGRAASLEPMKRIDSLAIRSSTMNAFIHMHRPRSLLLRWPIAIALAASALHAGGAEARETCDEASCGGGTGCEANEPGDPSCPDAPSSRSDCESGALLHCASPECASDADCASHMACVESPRQECEGEYPSCEPGESDDECIARVLAWQAAFCTIVTPLSCTPRWNLPCQSDASCGDKFLCDAASCVLSATGCSEDADCPVTWFCATINVGPCIAVPGGTDDECQYSEPPIHECVEPTFGVREDVGEDGAAPPEPLCRGTSTSRP